jgi:hypothetical protein
MKDGEKKKRRAHFDTELPDLSQVNENQSYGNTLMVWQHPKLPWSR